VLASAAAALDELGIKPTAWHITKDTLLSWFSSARAHCCARPAFNAALEASPQIRCSTTHTPVPAGTIISAPRRSAILLVLRKQLAERGGILALGLANGGEEFNMTALAIADRAFQGRDRIHGSVSSRICAPLWPDSSRR